MKEKEEIIMIVENAANQIKLAIQRGIAINIPQLMIISECNQEIEKARKSLLELTDDKEFVEEEIKGLKFLLIRWMNGYLVGVNKIAKENKSHILGNILSQYQLLNKEGTPAKAIKNGGLTIVNTSEKDLFLANQGIENIRDLMTNPVEGGVGRYVDYGQKIRDELLSLQEKYAEDPNAFVDAKGNKKNLRLMAEIKVRYDLISDDLKGKDVKYRMASSHPNSSLRCSYWQGKVYKVDIDVESRQMYQFDEAKTKALCKPLPKEEWIDGIPTYSLKTAIECGFLSYNCQHRLIKYYKGVKAPQYDFITVEKKRNLTTYQRALENKIRKTKLIEKVNGRNFPIERKNVFTGQMEKMTAVDYSKMLQDKYEEFCKKNGLVQYTWRTRITMEERGNITSSNNNLGGITEKVIETPKLNTEELTEAFSKHFNGDTKILNEFVSQANFKDENVYKILANSNKLESVKIETGNPRYMPGFDNKIYLRSAKDVRAAYHEYGHSLDHLVAKDQKYTTEDYRFRWVSDDIQDIRLEAKKEMNNEIPKSLVEVLEAQKNRINEALKPNIEKAKTKVLDDVRKNASLYSKLPKSIMQHDIETKLLKEVSKMFNSKIKDDVEYTEWSCLSDIYDAITDGAAKNANALTGRHGQMYYLQQSMVSVNTAGKVIKQNTEIFANFCELKMANATKQLDFLKTDQPKLYNKLEERFKFVADYLEDKKI